MAGLVLYSTAGLRLNFCAKLNICASISATSPSCKTLAENFDNKTEKKTLSRNYKVEKAENTTIKIKVGQLKIFNLL